MRFLSFRCLHLTSTSMFLIFMQKNVCLTSLPSHFKAKTFRSSYQRCSIKKVFLETSQNLQEKTCNRACFLIKLQAFNFIKKETLVPVFSWEFCKISKNTFSTKHLLTTASEHQFIIIKMLSHERNKRKREKRLKKIV